MRLIFAGTPTFARVALERLHAAGFEIPLVLTQPDRPAGRGMKPQTSPVKAYALEYSMTVVQPHSLRRDGPYPQDAAAAHEALRAARAEVMVVAAYGLILPQWVLDMPTRGCLNIHASLLPRWRGAAPIHRAIEAGDGVTGVTIMQMDTGLDTGDMLLTEPLAISADDTTGSLHDRLAPLGARLIVAALQGLAQGALTAVPQPTEGVSYAHKIGKAEAAIHWALPAAVIARRVRAFNPFPGAASALAGEPIKVWAAHAEGGGAAGRPGQVLSAGAEGIRVATGEGALVLTELQRAGGKRLRAADFLRGFAVLPGQVLDSATEGTD